ncbi:WD40 repeat domain-containing protein [Microvirga sp. W0021]|uniref:WD40 repeat domain-containing protein n=1 Tax=Hohaiivirga grylli TaxID=3133970 RepID=A0ABV0BKL8_9HYPH
MSSNSLRDNVKPITTSAHVVTACWLQDKAALALADGTIVLSNGIEDAHTLEAHPDGAVLVGHSDGSRLLTGGDDGRIVSCDTSGNIKEVALKQGRWIDAVAAKADGSFAYSSGKDVFANDGKGKEKTLSVPSSARGLAFAPKGHRLAISHYNGVTLWFPNIEGTPDILEWKGSHLDVVWSPDGRFVVTSMQESALHGWRLQDKNHMRMTGYPSKTRSFSWSSDGKWLATSGADAAIVWPFDSKDGPMGKQPRECGVRPARVSCVSFHPRALVLAVGYEDGCILLVRFTDASELLVRAETKGSAVTALAWDKLGMKLVYGCEDGQAGILTLPS